MIGEANAGAAQGERNGKVSRGPISLQGEGCVQGVVFRFQGFGVDGSGVGFRYGSDLAFWG